MTQITGVPQSITGLQDNKTYASGQENAFERAGTGFGGKISRAFSETFSRGSVARNNQAVLDSLMRQLRAEYGDGVFEGVALNLPADLAAGKKTITGADVKRLAGNALTASRKEADAVPVRAAIQDALKTQPVDATAFLVGLKNSFPAGATPQYANLLVFEAVQTLRQGDQQALQAVMTSQSMADLQGVLSDVEGRWDKVASYGQAGRLPEERLLVEQRVDALKGFQNLLGAASESLRTSAAALAAGKMWSLQNGQGLPRLNENAAAPNGAYKWTDAPAPMKNVLEAIGVPLIEKDLKLLLTGVVDRSTEATVLRGNAPGETILKIMTQDKLVPHFGQISDAVFPLFKADSLDAPSPLRGSTGRKEFMASEAGAAFMKNLGTAIHADPLKTGLTECFELLQASCAAEVAAKYPEEYSDIMLKVVCGSVLLPLMMNAAGEFMDPQTSRLEGAEGLACLVLQGAFNSGNVKEGTEAYTMLQGVPGFSELLTPPEAKQL